MKSDRKSLVFPILIIAIGVGWLLTNTGVMPGINWVWTLLLATAGVLILSTGGINKITVSIAPVCIVASFLSILRQNGRMSVDVEIPWLIISLGVSMLLAHHPAIPVPDWARPDKPQEGK